MVMMESMESRLLEESEDTLASYFYGDTVSVIRSSLLSDFDILHQKSDEGAVG